MVEPPPKAGSAAVGSAVPASARPLRTLLALLGLTGFAISQPLLSVLGENPSFFAFRNIDGAALIWFALGVALLPPLGIWVLVVAARAASAAAGRISRLGAVGLLVSVAAVQLAKQVGLDTPWLIAAVALAVGAGAAFAYDRSSNFRLWVQFTAVLPLIAVVAFLLTSDTSGLLRPPDRVAVGDGSAGEVSDLPSVVMVILDEFPTLSMLDTDRGIDPVRFPAIAAFAEEATWYRDFTTLASFTEAALPPLLTGKDPNGDPPIWTNHPDNLFSLLAPTHHLTVFESPT